MYYFESFPSIKRYYRQKSRENEVSREKEQTITYGTYQGSISDSLSYLNISHKKIQENGPSRQKQISWPEDIND